MPGRVGKLWRALRGACAPIVGRRDARPPPINDAIRSKPAQIAMDTATGGARRPGRRARATWGRSLEWGVEVERLHAPPPWCVHPRACPPPHTTHQAQAGHGQESDTAHGGGVKVHGVREGWSCFGPAGTGQEIGAHGRTDVCVSESEQPEGKRAAGGRAAAGGRRGEARWPRHARRLASRESQCPPAGPASDGIDRPIRLSAQIDASYSHPHVGSVLREGLAWPRGGAGGRTVSCRRAASLPRRGRLATVPRQRRARAGIRTCPPPPRPG